MSDLKINLQEILQEKQDKIIPDNIKKDVQIFDVIGTYEGSGSSSGGDVKLFETVEDMQADENAQEGDLAVVYKEEIQNMTADTQTQYITFPETVVLPEALTSDYYCMLRAIDTSVMFDGNIQLSSTSFMFDVRTESGSITVQYTSTDGMNYNRTTFTGDSGDLINPVDLGTIVGVYSVEEWNNNMGYFIQSEGNTFDGLYEYASKTDTNKAAWLTNLHEVDGKGVYDLERKNGLNINEVSSICTEIISHFDLSASRSHYIVFVQSGDVISAYVGIHVANNIKMATTLSLVQDTESNWGIGTYSTELTDGAYKITLGDTLTYTKLPAGTKIPVADYAWGHWKYASFAPTDKYIILSVRDGVVSVSSEYAIYGYNVNYEYSRNNYGITSAYYFAPNQYNLMSSNQLLPGVSAYGKNGNITGDGSIYNNIKNIDFINNWLYNINSVKSRISYKNGKLVNWQTFTKQSYLVNDELEIPIQEDDCITYTRSSSDLEYNIPEYDISSKTYNKTISYFDRHNDTNYYIILWYNIDDTESSISNTGFYVINLDMHQVEYKIEYNTSWKPVNNSYSATNYTTGNIAAIGYDFDTNTLYMVTDRNKNNGSIKFAPINVASLTSTGEFNITYNNVSIGGSSSSYYKMTKHDSFRWDNVNKTWSFVYNSWTSGAEATTNFIGKIGINSQYEELINNGTNGLSINLTTYRNLGPFISVSAETTSNSREYYIYNTKTKTKLGLKIPTNRQGFNIYSCYNGYIIASALNADKNTLCVYKINQETNEYVELPIQTQLNEITPVIYCILNGESTIFVADTVGTAGRIFSEDGKFLGYYKLSVGTYSKCHLPCVLSTTDLGFKDIFNENIVFENGKMTYTMYEQFWEKFVELSEFPIKGNIAIVCANNNSTKDDETYMYNSILLTNNINNPDYTNTISPTEYTTALNTSEQILGEEETVNE